MFFGHVIFLKVMFSYLRGKGVGHGRIFLYQLSSSSITITISRKNLNLVTTFFATSKFHDSFSKSPGTDLPLKIPEISRKKIILRCRRSLKP